MDSAAITAIGAAVVAIIGGAVGVINSSRANKPAEMNAQLAWVKSAQDDAAAARLEAREAKADAAEARKEAEETRRQAVQIRREFDAIQDWVDRVMRAADAYRADLAEQGMPVEDSGVIRLMRAINGGPHTGPSSTPA